MNILNLKKLLEKGQTKNVIKLLLNANNIKEQDKDEIILIAARFNKLLADARVGIPPDKTEYNEINSNLMEFINQQVIDPEIPDKMLIRQQIEVLAAEFDKHHKIPDNTIRLRLKSDCAKKISTLLEQEPTLITDFQHTTVNGIICGIAEKIHLNPSIDDLPLLETLANNAQKDFVKGTIVSALGRVVHSGQIRFGDLKRVNKILNSLKQNADVPLKKNIESVKAALNYLTKQQN